ncbi:MAG: hypothetical protein LBH92_03770 [Bacteroidales bacterium]|jgi:hypothetical protein|nr:hypothetical protein [Bacteroidales bacterium]
MVAKSHAQKISQAEIMISGLKNNQQQIEKRGVSQEFIDKMAADIIAAVRLNNEQEALKAQLKVKTTELTAKMEILDKAYAEAKKIVKLDFPQAQWKEFGIGDKR